MAYLNKTREYGSIIPAAQAILQRRRLFCSGAAQFGSGAAVGKSLMKNPQREKKSALIEPL